MGQEDGGAFVAVNWIAGAVICYDVCMSKARLKDRFGISSLAAPTPADRAALRALSAGERQALVAEAVELGRTSPRGNRSVDEIWSDAVTRARSIKTKRPDAI